MAKAEQESISPEDLVDRLGARAREASRLLAQAPDQAVDAALAALAKYLRAKTKDVLSANARDVEAARAKGLAESMIDRLTLSAERLDAMAKGVEAIAALPAPAGKVLEEWTRPNGLIIQKVSVPIGVLGMIYESRPNVTVDAAALCMKSRNAVILRGGSESLQSSLALHVLIQQSLKDSGLPEEAVQMVPVADRDVVGAMLACPRYIDVIVPRGGKSLTGRVMKEAKMPVFAHLDGNCHTYIHASADPDLAALVTMNAKMRRTGICGATESLLLDNDLSQDTAGKVVGALLDAGCEVVGDPRAQELDPRVKPASVEDWGQEYLDAKISCKYVADVAEAVAHINAYGSHHTDSILAEDSAAVASFLENVDSAIVMHNASTQFADGGEFGMGAEIGIGTGKLHARGPVGVRQLTTFKYVVRGQGQTRP